LAYTRSGWFAEGLPLLEQAVEQSATMRFVFLHTLWIIHLSEGYRLARRMDDAARHALRAFDLAQTYKEQGHEARTLHLLGDIYAHDNPLDIVQAETSYQHALTLATKLGMRPLQAHCHRGLGTLYRQTGQSEQARTELSTAIDIYRDMEMNFWLPKTEAALSAVEGR
jgi:tetratricopeptide (TPR) repeat protein